MTQRITRNRNRNNVLEVDQPVIGDRPLRTGPENPAHTTDEIIRKSTDQGTHPDGRKLTLGAIPTIPTGPTPQGH